MPTLREARASALLSVRALAAQAGVAPTTVHLVETGRQAPRLETIRRLATVLGVQPGDVDEFRAAIADAARPKRAGEEPAE